MELIMLTRKYTSHWKSQSVKDNFCSSLFLEVLSLLTLGLTIVFVKQRKSGSQFCATVSAWDAINSVALFPFFTSIVQSSQVLFFYFAVAGEYTWYWYALFLHDPNSSKQPDRFSFIIKAFLQLLNCLGLIQRRHTDFPFCILSSSLFFFNMNLPRLDNNSQLFPLLDGEQGQGDQQRAVQDHLVKVVQGCTPVQAVQDHLVGLSFVNNKKQGKI